MSRAPEMMKERLNGIASAIVRGVCAICREQTLPLAPGSVDGDEQQKIKNSRLKTLAWRHTWLVVEGDRSYGNRATPPPYLRLPPSHAAV